METTTQVLAGDWELKTSSRKELGTAKCLEKPREGRKQRERGRGVKWREKTSGPGPTDPNTSRQCLSQAPRGTSEFFQARVGLTGFLLFELPTWLPLWPHFLPFSPSLPSLLSGHNGLLYFLDYAPYAAASGPLHLLCCLECSFPNVSMAGFISLRSSPNVTSSGVCPHHLCKNSSVSHSLAFPLIYSLHSTLTTLHYSSVCLVFTLPLKCQVQECGKCFYPKPYCGPSTLCHIAGVQDIPEWCY